MKTKTLEINGHTVQSANQCSIHYRTPDAQYLLDNWNPDRIRAYLSTMSDPEELRGELNRLKGKAK